MAAPDGAARDPLQAFGPAVQAWFRRRFGQPTPAQEQAWPAIRSGHDTLVLAPTGSGKTLAAFLVSVDELARELASDGGAGTSGRPHTLYVSPLRALGHDIHRALEEPLQELEQLACETGIPWPSIEVAIRTGDTPAARRRAMARPHILITTPESLFLMLVSPAMRPALAGVRRIIVDELHALAPTKRGAHLALSLELLEHLAGRPIQRVGLSATQRPLSVMAAFLAGRRADRVGVVDAGARRAMDLHVACPDEASSAQAGEGSWDALARQLWGWVATQRSTLIFVHNRRQAERLTQALNEAAGHRVAATHHGSLGKAARLAVERALKAGELRAVVATASLELGIDVGYVDLVIHVGSPGRVSTGLQRVGRSGHALAATSQGRILARHPSDLVEAAAVTGAMRAFDIEPCSLPCAPMDVLAQHVVAAGLIRAWSEQEFLEVARRASSFAGISREILRRVLALLAVRPGEGPPGLRLRPRIQWDRDNGRFQSLPEARALLYAGAGTIPDRGTYPVVLAGAGVKLGELDEEFVYETRRGEVFWLGTAAWRVEQIRPDRVVVSPAPPGPAKLPFWRGDAPGRSLHVGRLVAQFLEQAAGRLDDERAFSRWAQETYRLDEAASAYLYRHLSQQRAACGQLPGSTCVVVEEFQDEAADRRIAVHSPWGAPVNRAWALAMVSWAREQLGLEPDVMACDDGILLRLPAEATAQAVPLVLLEGRSPADLVRRLLPGTPLFAQRFREAAARALLLPRPTPGRRLPLWQQRLRAGDLLLAASQQGPHGPLGVLLQEASRELEEQDLDLKTLDELVAGLREGRVACHPVKTRLPSPFARQLLFHFTAAFLYEPDAPKAERRAALQMGNLDDVLREAARNGSLGTLLDPRAVEEVTRQRRRPPWMGPHGPRSRTELEQWLSFCADLNMEDLEALGPSQAPQVRQWLDQLEQAGQAVRLSAPGEEGEAARRPLWVAASAVPLYRLALKTADPCGHGGAVDPEQAEAVAAMLQRRAEAWGMFGEEEIRARYGLSPAVAGAAIALLESQGVLLPAELQPGAGRRYLTLEAAREMRRRSMAAARRQTEPVSQAAFARFLARHHGIGEALVHGPHDPKSAERTERLIRQLAGLYVQGRLLPVVAAARFGPNGRLFLAQALASGRIGWVARPAWGGGPAAPACTLLARDQGPWVALAARAWLPGGRSAPELSPGEKAVASLLACGGSWFAWEVARRLGMEEGAAREALLALFRKGLCACEDPDVVAEELTRRRSPASLRPRAIRQRLALLARPVRFWWVGHGTDDPEAAGEALPDVPQDPAQAWARLLLERYGLVAPPCLAADGCPLPWAEVAGACRRLEAAGRLLSGYFVQGLGGLQFALPDTLHALREQAAREPADDWRALALQDPANPWGRLLDPPGWWPAGSSGLVACMAGRPVMVLQVGAGTLWHDPQAAPAALRAALLAILDLAKAAWPGRRLVLRYLQGSPVGATEPLAALAMEAGFVRGPRTLEHWLASA